MSVLAIETPEVFEPLLQPARYKGAYGGRGSGKSHFFAGLAVETCLMQPGTRGLCVREVQKSLAQSAKKLIEDKIIDMGVSRAFNITKTEIGTPGGGLISFQGLQDHTADSIKSFEGYDWAWIEEAQTLSERSLTLLRPTIRKDGSEIWASWNPRRKSDPIDKFLRGEDTPVNAVVVRANWNHNPFFPAALEAERLLDLDRYPERYGHIWEGEYATITEGAYFAADLAKAKQEKRIGHVAADPLMSYRAFWDIGGTGAKADACSIWIGQFIGREIRWLDYYEAVGQPLASHVDWLRENGYGKAECFLPHDGATHDRVHMVSFESALRDAGFSVTVVPNQGAGAARLRIEAARRLFPSMWFADKCEAGLEALGAYHERRDDKREIGLGPEHDWASHAADAFGLACIAYEQPSGKKPNYRRVNTKWVV